MNFFLPFDLIRDINVGNTLYITKLKQNECNVNEWGVVYTTKIALKNNKTITTIKHAPPIKMCL